MSPKSIFPFEELLWNSLLCKTTLTAKDFDNQFALQFKGLWRTHLNINHLKEKNVILILSYYTFQFPAMNNTFHISSWKITYKCNTIIQSLAFSFHERLSPYFCTCLNFPSHERVIFKMIGLVFWYLCLSYFNMLGRKWNYLICNFIHL